MIKIYTDGSSQKNRSGWGFLALVGDAPVHEYSEECKAGDTNQLMELTAALEACKWYEESEYAEPHALLICSDSAYLVNCYQDKWWQNWINNGWKTTKGTPVENKDTWAALIKYFKNPNIHFDKVAGHSNDTYNDYVDCLAKGIKIPRRLWYIKNQVSKINSVVPIDYDWDYNPYDLGNTNLTTLKNNDTIYKEVEKRLKMFSEGEPINNCVESIIKLFREEGEND